MISEAQLGWMAAILDLKGMALVKRNKQRATEQLVISVHSKDIEIILELNRMTGTATDMSHADRRIPSWMQRGCVKHCPDSHICHNEQQLPPVGAWAVTGAAALIVLHNVAPYMRNVAKFEELRRKTLENIVLTGRGSGMVRVSIQRLADLGWEIPGELLATGAFEGPDRLALPAQSLARLFI